MRFTGFTFRAFLIGAVVAIIAAACAGAVTGGDGAGATISLANLTDGDSVTTPFEVQIDASVPLAAPETGNHHAHLYFDTSTDAADYDIVYGNAETVTRELAPGRHSIIVALANPDHSLAGPTRQVTINVTGAGAPGSPPDGDGASPAPTSPPIDY